MLVFLSAETVPKVLDIVWCRFPHRESKNMPGPKLRPALVRATGTLHDANKWVAEVSYGTSRIIGNPPNCLIIEDAEELNACGLFWPTCFHLGESLRLPWSERYFEAPAKGYGRIAGHLPPSAKARLAIAARR